jgi:hypothetical protein
MKIALFQETQKLNQLWIRIPLLCLTAMFIWGLYKQLVLGEPWGSRPATNGGLLLGFSIMAGVTILFLTARLNTEIDETGIYYKFFPFHLKKHKIDWTSVEKAFVREYSPLGEFGGWGIRFGFGSGKAFNVSGNMGLQLHLKNKKRVLIGTQKPEEIKMVLEQLKSKIIPS